MSEPEILSRMDRCCWVTLADLTSPHPTEHTCRVCGRRWRAFVYEEKVYGEHRYILNVEPLSARETNRSKPIGTRNDVKGRAWSNTAEILLVVVIMAPVVVALVWLIVTDLLS